MDRSLQEAQVGMSAKREHELSAQVGRFIQEGIAVLPFSQRVDLYSVSRRLRWGARSGGRLGMPTGRPPSAPEERR